MNIRIDWTEQGWQLFNEEKRQFAVVPRVELRAPAVLVIERWMDKGQDNHGWLVCENVEVDVQDQWAVVA